MKLWKQRRSISWPYLCLLILFCSCGWTRELTVAELKAEQEIALDFIERLDTSDAFLKHLPDAHFFPAGSDEIILNEIDIISAIYENWANLPRVSSSGVSTRLDDFVTLYPIDYKAVAVQAMMTPIGDQYLDFDAKNQLVWEGQDDDWESPVDLDLVSLQSYFDLLLELNHLNQVPVAITSYRVKLLLKNQFHHYRAAVMWIQQGDTVEPQLLDSVNLAVISVEAHENTTQISNKHPADDNLAFGKSNQNIPICAATSAPFDKEAPPGSFFSTPLSDDALTTGHLRQQTIMEGSCSCRTDCVSECNVTFINNVCFAEVDTSVAFRYVSKTSTSSTNTESAPYPNAAKCQVGVACIIQECLLGVCLPVSISFAGVSANVSGTSIVGQYTPVVEHSCGVPCEPLEDDLCGDPDSDGPVNLECEGDYGSGPGGGNGGGAGNCGDNEISVFCGDEFAGCTESILAAIEMCDDDGGGDGDGTGDCPPGVPLEDCIVMNHEFDLFQYSRNQHYRADGTLASVLLAQK